MHYVNTEAVGRAHNQIGMDHNHTVFTSPMFLFCLGMHYVNIEASGRAHNQTGMDHNHTVGKSHGLGDLCCKAGVELELLLAPENAKFK